MTERIAIYQPLTKSQKDMYKCLAKRVLDDAKGELSKGHTSVWKFYTSGWYQLFTSICDINDDVYRKEIADIAIPVADKLGLKVSEIILFEGELNVKGK